MIGAGGFLGHEVTRQLLSAGYYVIAVSRSMVQKNDHNFISLRVDCVERGALDQLPEFDLMIHLAGAVSAAESMSAPLSFVDNNIVATANLLDLFRLRGGEGMIYASTAKVYPVADGVSRTPYGATKLCADLLVQEFALSYRLPIAILRFTSFYGPFNQLPRFPDQSWVNWFCYANLIGKQIALYGDGEQLRDPLYISDAANLIMQLVVSETYSIFSDVGGGESNCTTPAEILSMIQNNTGREFLKVEQKALRSDMKDRFVADNGGVKGFWKPVVSVEEGVCRTLKNMSRLLGEIR